MSQRAFVNRSTESDGKDWQYATIAAWINPNSRVRDGYRFTLVGCPSGLTRHMIEHRDEGFRGHTLIVVERDASTFKALQKEARELRFKGEIHYGDFIDVVIAQHLAGRKISHLDFDGVGNFNKDRMAERFFAAVQQVNAESYAYTWHPRSPREPQTESLCERMQMQKKLCKSSRGKFPFINGGRPNDHKLRFRIKELAERYTEYALPTWTHSEVIGYCGRGSGSNKKGGAPMQWIMGKRWTPLTAPFEDANL